MRLWPISLFLGRPTRATGDRCDWGNCKKENLRRGKDGRLKMRDKIIEKNFFFTNIEVIIFFGGESFAWDENCGFGWPI